MPRIAFELDVDFPVEQLATRTCRDVLLSNLEHDIYSNGLSGFQNTAFVTDMLNQAYEKVVRLIYHIRSLRTARNALAPISRLPNEVMLRIFWLCAPENGVVPLESDSSNLLAVSQVCTSWRQLALADPSLWTEIDVYRPDLAKLFLQRSQRMPVSIKSGTNSPWGDIIPNRDRLRALFLHQYKVDDGVTNYLCGRFPKLRSLQLVALHNAVEVVHVHAPQLQSLSLSDFVLTDLGTVASGNLTTLHIIFKEYPTTRDDAEPRVTLPAMLAMLRSCPGLTSLNLRRSLIVDAKCDGAQDDQEEAQLLRLQHLSLEEEALVISRLLPKIYIPACSDIHLPSFSYDRLACQELPASMRHCLQRAGWQPAHTVLLGFHDAELSVSVRAAYTPVPHNATLNSDLKLSLSLREWAPTADFFRMNTFFQAFSEHLLQGELKLDVYVSSDDFLMGGSSRFWAAIAALPLIRELVVGHRGASEWHSDLLPLAGASEWHSDSLLLALGVPGILADNTPRPDKPFSALRKLVLSGFDFSEVVQGQTIQEHLLAFQEQRQREGCPVDISPV